MTVSIGHRLGPTTSRLSLSQIHYFITQDLVHKLCNCESTYLESVDDVRDEMITHCWPRNIGSS